MANEMIRTSTSDTEKWMCWHSPNNSETTTKIKTKNLESQCGLCTQGSANSRDQFPTSFMIFGQAVVEKLQFRYLTSEMTHFFGFISLPEKDSNILFSDQTDT